MSASPGSWTARRRPVRAVGSTVGHRSDGPRFARFAAAMEAEPPSQAQVLPETAAAMPRLVRPGIKPAAGPTVVSQAAPEAAVAQPASPMPAEPLDAGPLDAEPVDTEPLDTEPLDHDRVPDDDPALGDGPVAGPLGGPAYGMSATVTPRRPVIDGRLRGAIPWLGIGSWVLFCGALFISLLGWPDQIALDRVTGIWSGHESIAHRSPETTTQRAAPTTGAEPHLPPAQDRASTPATADSVERLQPAEVAPDAGPRIVREPGGPPVPQFKPRIDDVAAKFSNAFFEIGNRLQQRGDFDAALHMRRQGTKLDPWRVSGARDS